MPHLTHAQAEARQQIVGLAQTGLVSAQLGRRLLAALQLAVPCDIQALFGVDPASLLFNRLVATNPADSAEQLAWLRHVYLIKEPRPELTFPGLMRANLAVVALHDRLETCWGAPAALFGALSSRDVFRLYHEIGSPAGGILRACFTVGGQWIGALQLIRLDRRRPFQRSDVSFLRLLAPTIARSLHSAFAREQALLSASGSRPEAVGVLVLAPNGRCEFSNSAAEEWCDILQRVDGHRAAPFPTAVSSVTACLRASLDPSVQPVVRVTTPAGTVHIEASYGAEDGSMAVIFAPDPVAPREILAGSWPLTPREREVLLLLVQGLSNRQIAAKLVVSENTVTSHLWHAYEKLGVHSRSELLARLFHEVFWPSLQDPGNRRPRE